MKLYDHLKTIYPELVSLRECGNILGMSDYKAINKFIDGLPVYEIGRSKKVLLKDLSKRIEGSQA